MLVTSDDFHFTEDGSALICDLFENDTESELWVAGCNDDEDDGDLEDEDDVRKDYEVGDDEECWDEVIRVVEQEESWDWGTFCIKISSVLKANV